MNEKTSVIPVNYFMRQLCMHSGYLFLRITQIAIPHTRRATGMRITNRMVRMTAVRVAMVMVVLSRDLDGIEIVVLSEVSAPIEPLKSNRLEPETIWFALSLKINGDVYTTAVEVTVAVSLSAAEEVLVTLSEADELLEAALEADELPEAVPEADELLDTEFDPEEEVLSAVLPSELLIVFTAFSPTILAAS